ncbi:SAF domain-containing protein [Brachybacterium massiliense]|uniref:SAF domain-containing protein n=1 Tax=Brachybacterium massiliense TaxID=1755098 RepID=UPI000B3BB3CF|nr:SAF domain-containing protein [Brachybacterium massiliense]
MLSRLRTHLPAWRRALRRRRRLLALLILAAMLAALLPSLLPPSVRGVPAVVADQDLPAGTVLEAEHLRTVHVAEELLPVGAPSGPDEVIGQRTAHPLPAGAPLLPTALAAAEHPLLPAGMALMVVPVPGALAPHLSPGTRVELFPTELASGAGAGITAQVMQGAESSAGAAELGDGTGGMPEILVAVPREGARELAHALSTGTISLAVID